MARRREKTVLVHLEPLVYSALSKVVIEKESSYSGYLRQLVIKDMIEKGMLTDRMVVESLS